MTAATQPNLLMGQRKANANLVPLRTEDPFAETLMYGVGTKNESEFVKLWPIGTTIAGLFRGAKTMEQKPGEDAPQSYIKIETIGGERLRAYAPGQLLHAVGALKDGQYFEVTYKGKEEATIKGVSRNVHAFDLVAEQPAAH